MLVADITYSFDAAPPVFYKDQNLDFKSNDRVHQISTYYKDYFCEHNVNFTAG